MDPELLSLLCCPVTRQPLRLLTEDEAAAFGMPLGPALIRADGRVAYRFDENGFPILLPEAGVAVAAVTSGDGTADHGSPAGGPMPAT